MIERVVELLETLVKQNDEILKTLKSNQSDNEYSKATKLHPKLQRVGVFQKNSITRQFYFCERCKRTDTLDVFLEKECEAKE